MLENLLNLKMGKAVLILQLLFFFFLMLIVSTHERPDAKERRSKLEGMNNGYTVYHFEI